MRTAIIADIAVRVYFELDAISALLMLFPRCHSGFRIAIMGETDVTDELPTVL